MKVSSEETAPREVVLNVELESADIEPFLEKSYKRVANRVQIPGFRPGKAPRYIVENYVGRQALIQESIDAIVQDALDKAIKEQELETFGEPDAELLEIDPPSFKATVPLEPIVDLGDFRTLRLEPEETEVTEEQVDRMIEQIRYDSAPWEPADRPVKFGDLVTLNVDGVIEGKKVADDKGVEFIPNQDNPAPFPGFSVYLEGMDQNEAKEFTLNVPEDTPDKSIAGKECRFNVKVLEIKEKNLMELDDEFAKGVGNGYENFEALRTSIQEDLVEQTERADQQSFQSKSFEEVIKGVSVELSDLTIKREIDHLVDERFQDRQGRRIDMDAYLRDAGKTQEELQDELRPAAIERLTRFLVLRKLATEEGIEVASEDIDTEIENISSRSSDSKEALRQALSSENARISLSTSIMNRRVLERLAEIVSGEAVADDVDTEDTETEEASEVTMSVAAPDLEASEDESAQEVPPVTAENITSDEPKDRGGNPSDD